VASKTFSVSVIIGAALASTYKRVIGEGRKGVAELGQTIAETDKKLKAARAVIDYRQKLETLRAKQQQLGRSSQRLEAGIADLEQRYRRAKQAARAYGLSIGDIVREERRLGRELERNRARLQALQTLERNRTRRRELLGSVAGAVGAAYSAARLLSDSIQLEDAQVRLGTVINAKDTAKALAESRRHALAFARRNLTSAPEIVNIEYALNSAGLEASAARVGSEIVAKVATVTNGVPEQVGEVIATVYNNLGNTLEGTAKEKLARIGDLLTKTQFKFQIRNFDQLGESLKYAAPALSQFNIALDQGVTLIGALNSAGLQGSMAGTALNSTLAQLSKAANEFNFEIVRTKDGQLDLIATMENLSQAIGGFKDLDQETADALQKAFGMEGVRAVIAFGKNLEKLKAQYQDVREGSKGLVDKSYQSFLQSTSGQLKILRNNLQVLGAVIGGTVLPAVNAILKPVTLAAMGLGKLVEQFPILGQVLGGIGIGAAGLFTAAVGVRMFGTVVSDALVISRTWLGFLPRIGSALITLGVRVLPLVATGIRAIGVALLANPVGAAIAGLGLAATLVIANWDKVKAFFQTIWDQVKPIWNAFAEWVGKWWQLVTAPFRAIGSLVGGAIKAVKAVFGGQETPPRPAPVFLYLS